MLAPFHRGGNGESIVPGQGAFRNGDDAEIVAVFPSPVAGLRDLAHIIRNLRKQNRVRPAGNSGAQGQPAGPMPHDFGDDDAVMAVRRAVQPVNRFGGNAECGVEANRRVGAGDVVINGLGEGDDVEAIPDQAQRVFVRATAADADEGVQPVAPAISTMTSVMS